MKPRLSVLASRLPEVPELISRWITPGPEFEAECRLCHRYTEQRIVYPHHRHHYPLLWLCLGCGGVEVHTMGSSLRIMTHAAVPVGQQVPPLPELYSAYLEANR